MARKQIGTVRITRARLYPLDPDQRDSPVAATVVVEPGQYPVYEDGLSRYWRMTGVLNHRNYRIGDGMFGLNDADVPSDDDVVVYSPRYGPDEWKDLVTAFTSQPNPPLVFTVGS